MIASQLTALNSGYSCSGYRESSASEDETSDSEEEGDETEESEEDKTASDAENDDFPLGRWYQTKTHFTLQSGGEVINSKRDRFE